MARGRRRWSLSPDGFGVPYRVDTRPELAHRRHEHEDTREHVLRGESTKDRRDRISGRMRNENERVRQGWAVGGACLEGYEEERVEQVQVVVPAVHRGEVPVDLHHGGLRVPRQGHHGCDDGEASQSEGKAWGKGRRRVRAGVPVRSVRCR